MDAGLAVQGPRASFRKPSHDTSQRNYRRRSPSRSPSHSPAPGGWKRDRSASPLNGVQGRANNVFAHAKKGKTEREDGNDGDGNRVVRGDGPALGTSELHTRASNHDRFSRPNTYEARRVPTYNQDRNHHRDSRGDARVHYSRRNADYDHAYRTERHSSDRGNRDTDRGRDKERNRVKEREKDHEIRGKVGAIDQDLELDRRLDRDWERDGDRRGKFGGRDYNDKDDVEHRSERGRSKDRSKDRERERPRSKFGVRETKALKNSNERESDRERCKEKERDRERNQGKFVGRDLSSSRAWDGEKKSWSRDRDKERDLLKEKFMGRDSSIDKDTEFERESDRGRVREYFRERERNEEKLSDRDPGKDRDDQKGLDRCQDRERHAEVDEQMDRYRHRDKDSKDRDKQRDRDVSSSQDPKKPSHVMDSERSGSKRERGIDHSLQREKVSSSGWDKSASEGTARDKEKLTSTVVNDQVEQGARSERDRYQSSKLPETEGTPKSDVMDKDAKKDLHAIGKGVSDVATSEMMCSPSPDDKRPSIALDAKLTKSSKWGPEGQISSEGALSASAGEELVNDLTAAKLAAMKAAELVNKNLGIPGFMSADQKKKLLWGSKKFAAEQSQEPVVAAGSNRWDTVHFSDPDRQEKFHKLMGVKADPNSDSKKDGDMSTALFTEEKQRELQQDLEKQFTAGLRRRDGRTVGLGL